MDAPLPPALSAWRSRGRTTKVFGHNVFVIDAPATAPPKDSAHEPLPLLILHGFPTSSFDFRHVLPRLSERRRVVVHDHIGFGLSDKPERYSYSLLEQADVAVAVLRELGIKRCHLLAHDYGTSVATELLARRALGVLPIELASVTLCNGSVHIELAHLTPSQKLLRNPTLGPIFARLSSSFTFKAQLRRIFGEPSSVSNEELDLLWAGLIHNGGRRVLPAISGYLDERVRFGRRWTWGLTEFDAPAHVLWGRRDPIAVVAIAERLRSELRGSRLTWLDHLGHYPMIEDAEGWAAAALSFLDSIEPASG